MKLLAFACLESMHVVHAFQKQVSGSLGLCIEGACRTTHIRLRRQDTCTSLRNFKRDHFWVYCKQQSMHNSEPLHEVKKICVQR